MEVNWVDIDYQLWKSNIKCWIVDKRSPKNAILKIPYNKATLIKQGVYKNDNFELNYNGFIGWLDKDLYLKIQERKTIDINDIGLSFRDYYIKGVEIDNIQKTIAYLNTLEVNNKKLIISKEIDITLFDDEVIMVEHNNKNLIESKINKVISHIIGYKIENNTFKAISVEKYTLSNYYTMDDSMIELSNINEYINVYLENTVDWLKNRIKLYLKMNDIKLIIKELTTNNVNPYINNEIKIMTGE